MKYDRLYNFISPKTGKIILPTDYTLVGDNRGFSYSSPILQHIQLDQIKLQKYLDDNTIFIDNTFDIEKRIRLKNLPLLGAAKFPLPDPSFFDSLYGMPLIPDIVVDALKEVINSASSIPIPNPTYDPFNVGDWVMNAPFMPQIIAGNPHLRIDGGIDPETIISSTTAFLHIAIAKVKKQLQYGNFIVKKRDISWDWDNIEKINSVTGAFDVLTNRYPTLDTYLTKAKNLFLSLYNLNSDHTFSENTQVLEELLTQHEQTNPYTGVIEKYKKGGVLALNNTADLKLAIPGSDYVDYKTNTFGPLCVIDVLASENSNKFISKSLRSKLEPNNKPINIPLQIQQRDKNKQDIKEEDWEVLNIEKINVRHELSFEELLDSSFDSNSSFERILAYDYRGRLVHTYFKNRFNNTNEFLPTAKTTNVLEVDYIKVKNLIASEIKNVFVKTDNDGKLVGTTDVFTKTEVNEIVNKAIEAVRLNLMGIIAKEVISIAGKAASESLFDFIGAAGKEAGKEIAKEAVKGLLDEMKTFISTIVAGLIGGLVGAGLASIYTEYLFNIKYKPMRSQNDIGDVDDLGNWGQGNLWFDANNKRGESENDRTHHRPGLRVNVWDSSVAFESKLPPISIGLFGYKWNLISIFDEGDRQEGFVFESDIENNKSHNNYRFPKNIILKRVKSKANQNGWDGTPDNLFGYDYYTDKFDFYKPVNIQNLSVTKSLNIPVMKSIDIPSNSTTGAMFFCDDL